MKKTLNVKLAFSLATIGLIFAIINFLISSNIIAVLLIVGTLLIFISNFASLQSEKIQSKKKSKKTLR